MVISDLMIKRETNYKSKEFPLFLKGSSELEKKYLLFIEEEKIREQIKNKVIKLLESEVVENDKCRTKIIDLKRKVFNDKKISEKVLDFITQESVQEKLSEYIKIQNNIEQNLEELSKGLNSTYNDEYNDVKTLFQSNDLIMTLIMSNKYMRESIYRFLNKDNDKKNRVIYLRLVKFLSRLAKKCSPLSNLTLTTISGINCEMAPKIFARFNYSLLNRWWDIITKSELIIFSEKYVASKLVRENEKEFYNTQVYDSDKTQLTKTSIKIKKYSKEVLYELMKLADQPISYSVFLEKLKGKYNEQQIKMLWKYLIDEKLYILTENLDETRDNVLEQITIKLKKYDQFSKLSELFEKLKETLMQIEEKFEETKYSRLKEIAEKINDILSISNFFDYDLVYFDYLSVQKNGEANFHNFDKLFEQFQFINMMFDPELKRSLMMRDYFIKNYGKNYELKGTIEILDFLKEIGQDSEINNKEIMDSYFGFYKFTENFSSSAVNELNQLGKKFITNLKSLDFSQKVITVTDSTIQDFVEKVKEIVPSYRDYSQNLFIQEMENSIVVNHAYPGKGMFFLRFLKYLDNFNKESIDYKNILNLDTEIIDISPTFGFNANVREHITERTLQLPYYNRSSESEIFLENLILKYNDNKGILSFYKSNEVVRPLYLGTLVVTATPVPIAALNTLGRNSSMLASFSDIIFANEKDKGDISHLPRFELEMGEQKVILEREKWKIKVLDSWNVERDDFKKWLKILNYFTKNKIPYVFFMRDGQKKSEETLQRKGIYKPQYINLFSPSLYKIFSKALQEYQEIIVEEEYPIFNQSKAIEYIIESSLSRKESK